MLIETRDRHLPIARSAKEHKVADAPASRPVHPGETEVGTLIEGWRGGEPVVLLLPRQLSMEAIFPAANAAARMYGCDEIVVTVEMWASPSRTNPVTGRPWGPDEMQQVAHEHAGRERGWVSDALNTFCVNRAGDVAGAEQLYRVVEEQTTLGIWRRRVEWTSTRTFTPGDGLHFGGPLGQTLVRLMNAPTLEHLIARRASAALDERLRTADPEERQAHLDVAVTRFLMGTGEFDGNLALRTNGRGRRSEIVEDALADMPGWTYGPDGPREH